MKKDRCTAIVLAAGKGKRMGSEIQKQYLLLNGRPMLYYSLDAFQKCERINEIILVAGAGEEEYCQREIVEKYRFSKVVSVVPVSYTHLIHFDILFHEFFFDRAGSALMLEMWNILKNRVIAVQSYTKMREVEKGRCV